MGFIPCQFKSGLAHQLKNAFPREGFFCEKKQQLISVSNITVESSENVSGTGDFIFTHPESGKFICGKFFDKNNNKITAKIDTKENSILNINDEIKNFTYSYDDKYESVQAKVSDFISLNNDNFIIFQLN